MWQMKQRHEQTRSQKRNAHTDGAVGTCLQNTTRQVCDEHGGIFQTGLEMCRSDVLGCAHPGVCKRHLCGGVMALPETAERRVTPVIQFVLQQTDRRPGAAGRRCRGRSHMRCPVEAQERVLLLTFRKMRFDYSFQTLQTHTG